MKIDDIKRPWTKSPSQGTRYNPDPFYHSTDWRKARASFLSQNPYCAHCLEKGRMVAATMVDHVTRIKAGGDRLNPSNFQSLCSTCHAKKSAVESNESRNKSL